MKRTSIILPAILAIGIFLSGTAFGLEPPEEPPHTQSPSMEPQRHRGPQKSHMPYGMMLLVRCQEINVLAELTGLTQENIRQLLISSPPPAMLDAYDVPMEAFIPAMDKQTGKLVKQAVVSGIITKKQEEESLKWMARKPARPYEE